MKISNNVNFLTYPMRPLNGGNFELAGKRFGKWIYQGKYNGWRCLIHVPTRTMWNRHGQILSIAQDFSKALDKLKKSDLEWIDAEALQRRHNIGKGSLIIFDTPCSISYEKRRILLENNFTILPYTDMPKENDVYLAPDYNNPFELWEELRNNPLYEGIVAKKSNSLYSMQTISPNKVSGQWIKYRYV